LKLEHVYIKFLYMSELPAVYTIPDMKDHELWFCDALPLEALLAQREFSASAFPSKAKLSLDCRPGH
jgi:hypothetical protein